MRVVEGAAGTSCATSAEDRDALLGDDGNNEGPASAGYGPSATPSWEERTRGSIASATTRAIASATSAQLSPWSDRVPEG